MDNETAQDPDTERLKKRIGLVVVGLMSLWMVFLVTSSWYAQTVLARAHAITRATVTGESASGHAQVDYTYEVDGRQYTGTSRPPQDLAAGDTVDIYYALGHPSISSFDPESHLMPQIVIFPAFFIFFYWNLFRFFMNPDRMSTSKSESPPTTSPDP